MHLCFQCNQGHNLGMLHSGIRHPEYGDEYGEPSCNMGVVGASTDLVLSAVVFYLFFHSCSYISILLLSSFPFLIPAYTDMGRAYCFNPAKTWYNDWYSSGHAEVDPISSPYDGELVGINAVRDGTIRSGQDVVLKIASLGETSLFVMFNRKIGTNSGVEINGDEIIIVSQSSSSQPSLWEAGLSSGQTHTVSDWSDTGTLYIKVCSIDLSSPPGEAHILVYADGQSTPSCPDTAIPPTAAPVQSPTASPIASPTTEPVRAPTSSPVSAPTNSPVQAPTSRPVSVPTVVTEKCQDQRRKCVYKINPAGEKHKENLCLGG